MFEAVAQLGREGISELDLVAAAESVSRSEGFGGQVQMRRFPLECNRGVIVSGRAGGVPSFFDSAIGEQVLILWLEWVQDSTKSNRMNPFSLIRSRSSRLCCRYDAYVFTRLSPKNGIDDSMI